MGEELLRVRDLRTRFHTWRGIVKAVDEISFVINKGETFGLVGESACGKSTTALSIMRLVPDPPGKIAGGEILLEDLDLLKLSEEEMRKNVRGTKISMIFQDPLTSLNPVFPVGFQVSEAILAHQEAESLKVNEQVVELFEMVGIPSAETRAQGYPFEFSGGMRQRIMIAMALSCNPQLLIADEPTTNLDVTIQVQVLELMKNLQKNRGTSILLITHDLGIVAEMADKVAVMYAGKIVENSDIVTIYKNPKHPYTQALIASIPRVDVEIESLRGIPGKVPSLINPPPGCSFSPRCPYATEKCSENDPKPIELRPGHVVSCLRVDEIS